jgi:hypothetical protein
VYLNSAINLAATLAAASKSHCSATLPGGSAYIFGGKQTSVTSLIQKWNGTTRSSESATLANAAFEATCTPANGANLYVFGGWDNNLTYFNTIQKFNGSTRTTESATATSVQKACSATLNNNAYTFGGGDPYGGFTDWIHKWDGSAYSLKTGAYAKVYQYGSCATLEGKIYIFGSTANTLSATANSVKSWDETTSTTLTSTLYGVNVGTAQTYDNSIYLYGGSQGGTSNGDNDATGYDSAITRWNPTGAFTMSARLATDVGFASSAAV